MPVDVHYSLATFSEFDSGALKIAGEQLGNDGTETGRALPTIQPLGLIARPRDPDADGSGRPTKGAGVLEFYDGHDGFSMPTVDPRVISAGKFPPIKKGGTAVYSSPGGVIVFDGDNGSLNILVPNADASKNHQISIDSQNGSIQLNHADGMGLSITSGGKNSSVLRNKSGQAYVEVNDEGVVINGNVTTNGGAVLGVPTGGIPVTLSNEVQALLAAINAILSAGLPVAGGLAKLAAPIVVPLSGSSKVSASP